MCLYRSVHIQMRYCLEYPRDLGEAQFFRTLGATDVLVGQSILGYEQIH
jgi:hypothetical protein